MYEKINHLVDRALDQDQEAIIQLSQELRPLVLAQIRKIHPYSRDKDREDLVSSAQLILLESLRTYQAQKKVPFVHYFGLQVRYYLLDQIKKVKGQEVCILDQASQEGDQTLAQNLASSLDIEEDLIQEEEALELHHQLAKLPQREHQVIDLFYFKDLGLSEISSFLGLSYQTIANTKSRALERLRRIYADSEKTYP